MAKVIGNQTDTPAQILAAKVKNHLTFLNQNWNHFQLSIQTAGNFIWRNPDGLTPQQALNAIGTYGSDLYSLMLAYADMVQSYTGNRPQIVPNGWSVTQNADGTLTASQP